jgi:uncharacterized protein YcfL
MDSLTLNDMTLILGIDMNANVSIEIHVTYNKQFILMDFRQNPNKVTYLKSGQNLKTIFFKLETQ